MNSLHPTKKYPGEKYIDKCASERKGYFSLEHIA